MVPRKERMEGEYGSREINESIRRLTQSSSRITISNLSGQNSIGAGISGNYELNLIGDAGDMLGAFNNGCVFIVKGSCGDNAGLNMFSGGLIIFDNCGEGCGTSMSGGIIVVKNKCGGYLGDWMRKGVILVDGDVEGEVGNNMRGGTIIVTRDIDGSVGMDSLSGEVYVGGKTGMIEKSFIRGETGKKDIDYLRKYFEHYAIDAEPSSLRKYVKKS